ncbi:MAG: GatB/YqeY domain-containing protein [Cytophagaceae bacterium]|jgi:uncharacterized protein YqeY|nr:GatB/YqeY domain-containing protein [Cytophagaceae bacterium]
MSLIETISEEIKSAMKAREQIRLETLRAIKKELLEARTAKDAGGVISDEDEIRILQKMVKQRNDASEIYKTQGRQDLCDKEVQEAAIISAFLPAPMSAEEVEAAVRQIIEQTGAASMKEMGKVMGEATKALAGKADGKEISAIVRKLLS